MTREEREAYWEQRVAAQATSGLSARAWCRKAEVAYATFTYWRRRLQAERTAMPPLTLIQVSEETPSHAGLRISVGVAWIEVPPDFDANLLRRVVAALSP